MNTNILEKSEKKYINTDLEYQVKKLTIKQWTINRSFTTQATTLYNEYNTATLWINLHTVTWMVVKRKCSLGIYIL